MIIQAAMLAHAQQPKVSVEMDSTYVTFGCPMTFHLKAVVPEGQQIAFPQDVMRRGGIVAYDDTLQFLLELDTFSPLKVDTVQQSGGMVTLAEDVTVFAFDSATLYIPPFDFVTSQGDTLQTNSLALKVFVPFDNVEIDPQKFCAMKDVEDPEFVFLDYIWYFIIPLLIIALAVAAWLGWRYYKRHKKDVPIAMPKAKPLPPHVVAMQALDTLAEKKLWQSGKNKQFHTELTDILRRYIEDRFNVPAMEKTTDEILDELYELAQSQKASLVNLKQVLTMADLVKFAKYEPYADENQLSFMNSKMFVEQTKVEETTTATLSDETEAASPTVDDNRQPASPEKTEEGA